MMSARKFTIGLAALSLAMIPALAMGSDTAALVAQCEGCHGTGGVSQWDDMPTIASLSAPVQEDALFVYMDEARPCAESEYRQGDTSQAATTMCAIAASLSEDDIVAIAAHFEAQPFSAFKQEFDAAKAEAGKAVHEEACDKCHSAGGSDPADDASILAGQPMGYLKTSFAEFMSGEREQPKNMKKKMDELSETDVESLIHYYASQQ